ncbi:MAG: hypothetical protein EBR87_10140, partial [Cytophagia bacterium]|nr:hypothetical protein [Cytophagia bacterium]
MERLLKYQNSKSRKNDGQQNLFEMKKLFIVLFSICSIVTTLAQNAPKGRRLQLLFLGDKGHHKPFDRYPALQSAIGVKGMNITYTENLK